MSAPAYPRVPHLVAGRGSRDDQVLGAAELSALLGSEVVVEEKLDGANVNISGRAGASPEVGLRGGDSRDRAGQRGPLRAWAAAHDRSLRAVLASFEVVYAEWSLLTHSIAYDHLPSYLVVLDLWRDGRFAGPDERDDFCREAGLVTPPQRWRGVPGDLSAVEALIGDAAWGGGPAEGVVVRRVGLGEPRLAKLLGAGFERAGDEEWSAGRPRNRLAGGAMSWR